MRLQRLVFSRSEAVPVAVGFNPTEREFIDDALRRGATPALNRTRFSRDVGCRRGRRYATHIQLGHSAPWDKSHGYRHGLAMRAKCTTPPFYGRLG